MHFQRRDKEDFDKAVEELDEEDKDAIAGLRRLLDAYCEELEGPTTQIDDPRLQKMVATLCFKLIDQTPKDEIAIMETAYVITGYFGFYTFQNEKLQEAIDLAGELELPPEHTSGDTYELWDDMRRLFKKYLDNKS